MKIFKYITIERFINKECIDIGICVNWNWKPGIEFSLLFWRIYIEIDFKKWKKDQRKDNMIQLRRRK